MKIEEAAKDESMKRYDWFGENAYENREAFELGAIFGAKWQAEQNKPKGTNLYGQAMQLLEHGLTYNERKDIYEWLKTIYK